MIFHRINPRGVKNKSRVLWNAKLTSELLPKLFVGRNGRRAEYPNLIPRRPGGIRGSATPCGRRAGSRQPTPYLTPQQKLAVLISHLHGKYANKVKAGVLEAL